ncbi:MAG: GMC family oxidoreductase [Spirochaetes bacterium]|nr:GMC family oxidoreductase [Spirochaetota bacterium]
MTGLRILKGGKGRILSAIMNAIIPRGGAYGPGAADFDLLPAAEGFVKSMNLLFRIGFPFLLLYMEYGALLRTGKRLTRLPDELAAEYLESFDESRFYYRRAIILALKMIAMLAFYDRDENASLIGYSHWSHRAARKKRAKASPKGKKTPDAAAGIRQFGDYAGDIREECDVCVIGSGAGGAVAAKELAEKGLSVILLEEGGHYTRDDWNGKPLSSLRSMWRDGGLTGSFGSPFVSITLGKCIGGTTAVNSATCFRTPDAILKKWRTGLGLDNLTLAALRPYFERVEKELHVTTLSWDVLGNCAKIIKRGCDRLGLSCRPLRHNVIECAGAGTCQFGCPENAKQSTDVSYIPRAVAHGARVYANCRAEKLVIGGAGVAGVRGALVDPARDDKKIYSIDVKARAVVVSCGSLITPQLLWKSGIKNRHIGRHLQIHPAGRVCALMKDRVEGWKGVSQGAYVDDYHDEGIALEGIFIHPSMMLSSMPGVGMKHKDLAVQFPHLAAFGIMIHDSTEGRVYPWRPMRLILSKYIIRRDDVEKFKKALAYTARIFFAAGAKQVYTGISRIPVLNSMEDAERLLGMNIRASHLEILAFHPLGTCRMAARETDGVVNRQGEVFGVPNLYVADGSVVPTSLGVNPQITIMALATYIADGIVKKLRRREDGVA